MVKKIRPVSRVVKIEAEIKTKDILGLDESWVSCVDISEKEVMAKVQKSGK